MIALPPPPPAASIDCSAADASTVLVVQQTPARPGATLRIGAASGPWRSNPVPVACLAGWRTSDHAVTLSPDHSSLIVGADAVAGRTVEVSTAAKGRRITTTVRIVGRDEIALTGYWKQDSVDCGTAATPGEPVRELHFDDKGGYSATFTPFESYKDYWGTFALDAASGAIAFAYDSGNLPAEGLDLTGTAALGDDGKLTLDGLFLGERGGPEGRSCRYVFVRQ
jgi:hypothetical protein